MAQTYAQAGPIRRPFDPRGIYLCARMQFGKLPSLNGLTAADFALPESHWHATPSTGPYRVYAGGTTWNIPEWVGSTYPEKTPRRRFPEAYGHAFGTIEFNATHYRIYPAAKMKEWADATPEHFRFCPKFPQIISHFRRFSNCEGPTDDFIEGLLALGNRLGPSFIQLPPHFAPRHADALWAYLAKWPRELPVSVEFRHPDWFVGVQPHWERLAELGVGAVISDTAGRRDALHMHITAPHVLVRFGGYEGHAIDAHRLEQWGQWIEAQESRGGTSFHLLVHEPDSLHTPHTCDAFARALKGEKQAVIATPSAATSSQANGQMGLF